MKYKKSTRQGMARRKYCRDHFNPANGEPHTPAYLEYMRRVGLKRARRYTYSPLNRSEAK